MKSQVDRGMSHQLKMMSISLNKTNKKLDTLINLITPKEEVKLNDDGECSVCGTTAPRMYPKQMKQLDEEMDNEDWFDSPQMEELIKKYRNV